MMYDIAAMQHLYGANYTTNAGNTVYTWSPTTGEMSINGVGPGRAGHRRRRLVQPRLPDDLGRRRQGHLRHVELHDANKKSRSTSRPAAGRPPPQTSSPISAAATWPAATSSTRSSIRVATRAR
jgi:hypothetical protein